MSDEPVDLQELTGAPRSKVIGVAFVVACVALIYVHAASRSEAKAFERRLR